MKTGKILVGIGLLLLTGIVLYRKTKKEIKKIEKEEKKIDEELEKRGITKEDLEKRSKEVAPENPQSTEEVDESDNLVLTMHNVVHFGSSKSGIEPWDLDLIRVNDVERSNGEIVRGQLDSENIIHVSQSDTRDGRRKLEFIFEIPASSYSNKCFNCPKIDSYKNTFHELASTLNDLFVKDPDKNNIDHYILGYYLISYKIRGKTYTKKDKKGKEHTYAKKYQCMIEIPKRAYEQYDTFDKRGRKISGLKEYLLRLNNGSIEFDEVNRKFNIGFFSKFVEPGDEVYDLKLESTFLTFKIGFFIKDGTDNVKYGLDLYSALDCLKYLTEEVVVYKKNSNLSESSAVRYEHIMFHARDPKYKHLGFDNMLYYTVSCEDEMDEEKFANRRVMTELLEYDLEEDEVIDEEK